MSNEESNAIFDIDLAPMWVQAVWIEVENNDVRTYLLLSSAMDSDYYAPDEIAYSNRFFMSEKTNKEMVKYFRELNFTNPIFPGTVRSGFMFVNLDEGDKEVNVELLAAEQLKNFTFFFSVPGLRAHSFLYAETHYPIGQIREVDEEELRLALQNMPCCTTNKDGTINGDPLNLVFIGNAKDLFPAFVRRAWHPAEETYSGSIWKTIPVLTGKPAVPVWQKTGHCSAKGTRYHSSTQSSSTLDNTFEIRGQGCLDWPDKS